MEISRCWNCKGTAFTAVTESLVSARVIDGKVELGVVSQDFEIVVTGLKCNYCGQEYGNYGVRTKFNPSDHPFTHNMEEVCQR